MLAQKIEKFEPYNEEERSHAVLVLKYLSSFYSDLFSTQNDIAHFTASAWVVNKDRTKVLMMYHKMYKSWTGIIGHADGERNLAKVAMAEITKETGLKNLHFVKDEIFAIQLLRVLNHEEYGKMIEPHIHLDCCYLIEANENEKITPNLNENGGVKWVDIDEVLNVTTEKQMIPIYKKFNDRMRAENL